MPAEFVLIPTELVLMWAEAVDKVVLMFVDVETVIIPAELVLMPAEAVDNVVLMPEELVLMPSLPSFYKAPISPDPQTPTVELVLIPAELVLIPSSTSSSLLELSSLNIMSALPPDCF